METPIQWKNPYRRRFQEAPLTIVKDLYHALRVELIQKPQIIGALREFVECGSMNVAPNFTDAGTSLKQLIQDNALWQGLETLHFTFRVTGCSRMLTHQLVRQRIGITFSQQCSDSVDWRHQNIVLPSSVSRNTVPSILTMKMLYAEQIDSFRVSCQEARYLLPQCLETFIYIHVSLATLIFMIKKRACTMSQPWETYLWAQKTRRVILDQFPMLASLFTSDCSAMRCFYHRAKKNPTSAYLYQPDAEHGNQKFKWDVGSYVYSVTHREMSGVDLPIRPSRYYKKFHEISAYAYAEYAEEYKLIGEKNEHCL